MTSIILLIGTSLSIGPISLQNEETIESGCIRAQKEMNITMGYAGQGYRPHSGEIMSGWYGYSNDGKPVPTGTPWIKVGNKYYINEVITCVPSPTGLNAQR